MTILPHDPEQQKQLFVGVLPFVLLLAYWQFYHGRSSEAIAAQQTRLERLETGNTAARALAVKAGPELDGKLAFYRQRMALLEQLIPTTEQVPELLHDVTLRAQRTGVDLTLVRPQPAPPGPPAQPESYYTLQTYELSVWGTYHDIGRFLTAIGSLPRIVIPVDLQLRRSNGTAGGGRVGAGGAGLDSTVGSGRDRGGEDAATGERDGVALDARFRIQTYVLPTAERREAMQPTQPKTATPEVAPDTRAGSAAPAAAPDSRTGSAAPAALDARADSAAPVAVPDTRTAPADGGSMPDARI